MENLNVCDRFDLFWCSHSHVMIITGLLHGGINRFSGVEGIRLVWSIVCSSLSLATIIRKTVFPVSSPS